MCADFIGGGQLQLLALRLMQEETEGLIKRRGSLCRHSGHHGATMRFDTVPFGMDVDPVGILDVRVNTAVVHVSFGGKEEPLDNTQE